MGRNATTTAASIPVNPDGLFPGPVVVRPGGDVVVDSLLLRMPGSLRHIGHPA